jgi:hypothetical protein
MINMNLIMIQEYVIKLVMKHILFQKVQGYETSSLP